eukprot:scaffold20309_cov64-Phaeocystis_antarctica.AAC.2
MNAYEATLVGAELPGDYKWSGGVLAADGNIYGIPEDAAQVLRFDPRTQQAMLVGDQLPGGGAWSGGVLADDGNIYGIPLNAEQVLSVAVAKAAAPVAVVKEHVPGEKVLEATQTSSAADLLQQQCSISGGNEYYVTSHITWGNVAGDIYNSEKEAFARFAELDGGDLAAAVWDEQLAELKYYGNRGDTRPEEMKEWAREHSIPSDAVNAYEATLGGAELPGAWKWAGGVLAADGNIYGIPWRATQVLRFDPRTQQATLVGGQLPGGDKWLSSVLAADGNIYGIPCGATQ